ncbi:MAG: hypothetical protein KDE26_13700 [Bacteroidetes bacterium]|nr:hypothetical protein [Bacteroidota bacterium]MCB0844302.1 hypothetical protein [Bacteroidota bacterium]
MQSILMLIWRKASSTTLALRETLFKGLVLVRLEDAMKVRVQKWADGDS